MVLPQVGDQRRDRLLPHERDARVHERQRAGRRSAARKPTRAAPRSSERRCAATAAPADAPEVIRRSDTVALSSQSRLRTTERAGAGIGHRPANRDPDVARAASAPGSEAERTASIAAATAQPQARLQRIAAEQADMPPGEEQHRAPRHSSQAQTQLVRVEGDQQRERHQRRSDQRERAAGAQAGAPARQAPATDAAPASAAARRRDCPATRRADRPGAEQDRQAGRPRDRDVHLPAETAHQRRPTAATRART